MPSSSARSRVYLRRVQGAHGGWPLFHEGAFDMSASVKAYFALKMIGDPIDADHMRRAREAIRAHGGAARANVFTRTAACALRRHLLARRAGDAGRGDAAAEVVPVPHHEDRLLEPHRHRAAAGAASLKPRARNPKGVRIDELFLDPPEQARLTPRAPQQNRWWFAFFRGVDTLLRVIEPAIPQAHSQARGRSRGRLRGRASQWRGRHRRDLPGDGQQRADVRHARLSEGSSARAPSRASRSRSCWS